MRDGQRTGLKIKFNPKANSAVLLGKLTVGCLGCITTLTPQTQDGDGQEQHLNLQLERPDFAMAAEEDLQIKHEFTLSKSAKQIVIHLTGLPRGHPQKHATEYSEMRCDL